jgi:hypothetical protein
MPAGPLRARADSSAHLVTAALTRAQTLQGKVDCSCMSGAPTDELGPVPCTVCQPVPVATPGKSGSQPAKHPHGKPSVSQSIVATVTEPATVSPRSFPPAVGPTPTPSSPGQVLPSLPIPLPTSGVPSLPLTVSSCGASLSLGPIHVGLGLCTPGVHASLHP